MDSTVLILNFQAASFTLLFQRHAVVVAFISFNNDVRRLLKRPLVKREEVGNLFIFKVHHRL